MINPEDEVGYDDRGSCTEEEASAMLLGWMRNAVRKPYVRISNDGSIDISQLPDLLALPCSALELIGEEREQTRAKFVGAVVSGDFGEAQRREEKISQLDSIVEKMVRYKMAIQQELARSNSKLKLDPVLTGQTGVRHITLPSLDTWARITFGFGILGEDKVTGATNQRSLKQPRTKTQQQEAAILEKLRELGFDPMKLPKWQPNAPGAKATARKALGIPSLLFPSDKAFNKAWGNLRKSQQLAEGIPPNS
ncbi:hypothetical protein [Propionivibrio sp.]|uniref:hypothetical protein n=1 Tax=Propionivibrio sp. TaxID=2212460 RepID=UPI0039E6A277